MPTFRGLNDWMADTVCKGLLKVAHVTQAVKAFEPRSTFKWIAPTVLKDGSELIFRHAKPSPEATKGFRSLIALSHGKPVFQAGFTLSPQNQNLLVTEFKLVDPEVNARRGIGTKVMERLNEFAEAMPGVRTMSLFTAPLPIDGKSVIEGDELLAFYRRAGFKPRSPEPGAEFMTVWDKPVRSATPLERLPIHGLINRIQFNLTR